MSKKLDLLVGDNAFHGISHLSQQRARDRAAKEDPSSVENATKLVRLSLQNGANGFMFSVSETTLSILKALHHERPNLYAIVPYAYEYVRLATKVGGTSGLAKKILPQVVFSRTVTSVVPYIGGLIRCDPSAFLKAYLIYEISRIKSAAGKNANLKAIFLHEVITDMVLALNLDWLFKSYFKFLLKKKIQPGLETRNFSYLVKKLNEWNIDTSKIAITASFNKIGFQMNPSQVECEKALEEIPEAEIIAMSVFAAGRLKPTDAFPYILKFPAISRVAVGVSTVRHASETFRLFRNTAEGARFT